MSQRNLALIGAGYWGKNLARNFHALGSLHTLCDLSPVILESYGADYAGVRKTIDVASLWADPEVKQVAIAAPAAMHYWLAKEALRSGKDVFVEKPLCLDLNEAGELLDLARQHGRILMVGHLLQYHPVVQCLQEVVAAGDLGDLHYITSNRLNLGKIRREENALWSFAPHDLSVILSLAGSRLPTQVRCLGGSYVTPGIADATLTTMSFTGGLRTHIFVSWLNPFKEQKLTVVGSQGMAVFDDTRPWAEKLTLYRNYLNRSGDALPAPNKLVPEFPMVQEAEPLQTECAHFLACCRDRRAPRTDGQEGERVLRVLQAAQASLERDGELQTIPAL